MSTLASTPWIDNITKLLQKDGEKLSDAFCLYTLLYSSSGNKFEPAEMYVLRIMFKNTPIVLLCQKTQFFDSLYVIYTVSEEYLRYYLYCCETSVKCEMKLIDAQKLYLKEHHIVPNCLPSSLNVGVKCAGLCGIVRGSDHMSGSFIVDFFINFCRLIHVNLELEDCSIKRFPLRLNQDLTKSIKVSLKLLTILKTGNSWYGNHGFKVVSVSDEHACTLICQFRNYGIIRLKSKLETIKEKLINNDIDSKLILLDFIDKYMYLIGQYIDDTGTDDFSFWKFAMYLFENDLMSYSTFVDEFMFCEQECGISSCHPNDDMYFEANTTHKCCLHGKIISFELRNMWLVINEIYREMILPLEDITLS